MTINVGIIGTGKYIPSNCVTNNDIVKMGIDTSHEWIVERTGISQRYLSAEDESSSDMAFIAASNAIKNAKIDKSEIDLLIVATTTPDYSVFPSTACLLQHKLGLKTVGSFDVSAA